MSAPSIKNEPSGSTVEALETEAERVKLELTLAQLRMELARCRRKFDCIGAPWWRSWNLTALGAFIAAMVPLTTGVGSYFQKQREIALEDSRQRQEMAREDRRQNEQIRNVYLDRLKDANERRRVLRFLIATSADSAVKTWATDEMGIVTREIDTKLDTLPNLKAVVEKARAALLAAQLRKASASTIKTLEEDFRERRQQLENLQKQIPDTAWIPPQ